MASTMRVDRLENQLGTVGINTSDMANVSQLGLVPVIPSSVTVAAGSATVGATGTVTMSAARNICLNGIFTPTYKNYKILISFTSSSPQELYGWFTSVGTNIAANWYGGAFIVYFNGTTGAVNLRSAGTSGWVGHAGSEPSNLSLDVYIDVANSKMQYSAITEMRGIGASTFGGYGTNGTGDGFRIESANSATTTGTVQVYGYK